jgi:tripartite-type tricarboxylate transporter receptor subunit TctC
MTHGTQMITRGTGDTHQRSAAVHYKEDNMKRMAKTAVLLLGLLWSGTAFGQGSSFPVKPINLYVGYPPGGTTVITAQIVAEGMKKHLGQPVVLNFKPGAVQAIAAEFVKNAKPDGYTIAYFAHGNLVAKLAKDKIDGEPVKFQMEDLDPLGAGPYSPYVLAVNGTSPWKTIEDLVAAARKASGTLNYGPDGMGTSGHLLMELFAQKAGIVLSNIPFQGAGPAITALLGGHVQMVTYSNTALGAHVKPGGGLRPLIVFDKKRDPSLPNVPTALERGFDVTLTAWQGLRAPKGLPKIVRDKLVQTFEKAMKDPEILKTFANLDSGVAYLNPEDMEKQSQQEYRSYMEVWEKMRKK